MFKRTRITVDLVNGIFSTRPMWSMWYFVDHIDSADVADVADVVDVVDVVFRRTPWRCPYLGTTSKSGAA